MEKDHADSTISVSVEGEGIHETGGTMGAVDDLSRRLSAVAERVLPGVPMADIGTDHGLLPVTLVLRDTVPTAVAIDVAMGPVERARRTAGPFADRIEVRHADGLAGLRPGEVETVVIAGMGGMRMARILAAEPTVCESLQRIVLQPNTGVIAVRQHMLSMGWHPADCVLVEERGHFYPVEAWEPGPGEGDWSAEDLRWGKTIRAKPDPLLGALLDKEAASLRGALNDMAHRGHADHPDAETMRADLATVLAERARID